MGENVQCTVKVIVAGHFLACVTLFSLFSSRANSQFLLYACTWLGRRTGEASMDNSYLSAPYLSWTSMELTSMELVKKMMLGFISLTPCLVSRGRGSFIIVRCMNEGSCMLSFQTDLSRHNISSFAAHCP